MRLSLKCLFIFLSINCFPALAQEAGLAPPAETEARPQQPGEPASPDEQLPRSLSGRFRLQAERAVWADLLRTHIGEFSADAEAQNITPSLIRRLRQDISSILATEGYFSPQIEFAQAEQGQAAAASERDKQILVTVQPGTRTLIRQFEINWQGALADAAGQGDPVATARRQTLQERWSLRPGQPFRQDDWDQAKSSLTESLRADRYAAAVMVDSAANIQAEDNQADLQIKVDSGPAFYYGDLKLNGLKRYPSWLIDRYSPPQKGQPYSRARLLEFQRTLQNSPYFASVAVAIEPDPEQAAAVPVEVSVQERKPRDLSFGTGYSTNTGFRAEIAYRDRDILQRAWDLRSAIRIEQKRQLGYADIYLPPNQQDLDSFGVIIDRQDVSGLITMKNAVGIKRTSTHGKLEQRLGLNLLRVKQTVADQPETISRALVASVGWTWRDVDDAFAPRRGEIYQLDLAVSDKALLSDQRFVRSYGKYQRWIPVGKSDSVILRAEAGQVFSSGEDGIPDEYLFRTGGSTTVRGYAYQSLGIQVPGAVVGGRVMAVASAEYVHWLDASWGVASFADVGNAAESWKEMTLYQAVGIGGRYRTPAGPIALDLAYGKQSKKLRLDFSIAIAF